MTLPAQIQKQVDDAKAIIEQHYGQKTDADPAEANAAEGSTQEPVAQAATPAEEVRPQETPATPAEDENSPTYAQRWRSQQGIVNAVNRKLSEAEQRVATLEQLVSTLQAAPAPRQQAQPAQLLNENDVKEYGSEMIDFARRVTREEVAPLAQAVHDLNRRLEQLQGIAPVVQRVAANQQVTAEQSFTTALTRAVPDWGQVNGDPRFHDWLLTPDAMTGITRQTYLADAEQTLDLNRVVSIFQAWKRDAGVTETPQPVAKQTTATSNLEKMVAPGRASAASAAPTQKAEKTYTPQDISRFYAEKLHGKYRGREAEAQAIERDIFDAQRSGRIAQNAA